ncbi:MAG: hypothetical protein H6728_17680 [Myxococcales bacterium]|nr:hypothetical protein [Myxococcales bacterium]MCB9644906.1 hypothetical protein [Myxococcales bacterium]
MSYRRVLRTSMLWLFGGLLFSVLACDAPVPKPTKFFCTKSSDCDSGFVCTDKNICVQTGSIEDTQEPKVEPAPEPTPEGNEPTTPEEKIGPEEGATPEEKVGPEEATAPEEKIGPEEPATPEEKVGPEEGITPEETTTPEEKVTPEEVAPEEMSAEPVPEEAGVEPTPDGEVVTEPTPESCLGPSGKTCCAKDGDCAATEFCATDGFCHDKCTQDADCRVKGQRCIKSGKDAGKCSTCTKDDECETGACSPVLELCHNNSCTSDADCLTGTKCLSVGNVKRCLYPLFVQVNGDIEGWKEDLATPTFFEPPKSCMGYRYPKPGYEASTKDGVYLLKESTNYYTSCNMSYAGGGWTLVMKINSSSTTVFDYDAAYWTNDDSFSSVNVANTKVVVRDDAVLNANEAKFPSFVKIEASQVMLQMQTDPDNSPSVFERRRLILQLAAPKKVKEFANGAVAFTPVGSYNWRGLIKGTSLISNPCKEGTLLSNTLNSKVSAVRIGHMFSSAQDSVIPGTCSGPVSWIGVGGKQTDPNGTPSLYKIGAGAWQGNAANINFSIRRLYAYLWIREFPNPTQSLVSESLGGTLSGLAYGPGKYAKSCLEYRMPPAVHSTSGDFILEGGPNGKYITRCDMETHGGGWTLAVKSQGGNGGLLFDNALWTSGVKRPTLSSDLQLSSGANLVLDSMDTIKPVQLLMEQSITSANPSAGQNNTRTWLVAQAPLNNNDSLRTLVNGAPVKLFGYSLGLEVWREWFPGPSAKLYDKCVYEGFGYSYPPPSGTGLTVRARIGILGGAQPCGASVLSPSYSWVGIGGKEDACASGATIAAGASFGDCSATTGSDLTAQDILSTMSVYLR